MGGSDTWWGSIPSSSSHALIGASVTNAGRSYTHEVSLGNGA